MTSTVGTPKTPLRLSNKRQHIIVATETPDCYAKVTVETPRPAKRISKNEDKEFKNLTVAVRIRPMNSRELSTGSKNAVRVNNKTVLIDSSLTSYTLTKVDYLFQYDHVFWSLEDSNEPKYATQKDVFVAIGQPLLHQAFEGYNACLFAYGQTGSGKSYSMMGPDVENILCNDNAGIIPLFCEELFDRISQLDETNTVNVNISYFEIYNEKIHDLLSLSTSERTALKVREHPDWGPYVVNLSTHSVKSFEEMCSWMVLGNKNRATAATVMNEKSSRSHSIFAIELSISNSMNVADAGRRSKVSLVDLAGSERLGVANGNEEKLKEGVSINKSLLTLGKVICSLADQRKGTTFVPYRESVLTWLLKESLGGNSLTCMLATITPASSHVDETMATLRYACKARSITNKVHVNEDMTDRIIRELTSEVNRLKQIQRDSITISLTRSNPENSYSQELEELKSQMNEKEGELRRAQQMWENRFREKQEQQLKQLVQYEKTKLDLESRVRVMANVKDNVRLSPFQTNFLEEMENILAHSPIGDYKNESSDSETIKSSIDSIYDAAKKLQPFTEKEESLRLTFAKLMKTIQILESGLCQNANSNSKKVVTFDI